MADSPCMAYGNQIATNAALVFAFLLFAFGGSGLFLLLSFGRGGVFLLLAFRRSGFLLFAFGGARLSGSTRRTWHVGRHRRWRSPAGTSLRGRGLVLTTGHKQSHGQQHGSGSKSFHGQTLSSSSLFLMRPAESTRILASLPG